MPNEPDVVIVPYRDGPYLVRGPVAVRDQDGNEVVLSRHPVALCRCGKSQMRPFCDGTHQLIRFQAPSEPERPFPVVSPEPMRPRGPGEGPAEANRPEGGAAEADRLALHHAAELVTRALDALLHSGAGSDGHLDAAIAALRETARELDHQL